jgi:hypothetical protein
MVDRSAVIKVFAVRGLNARERAAFAPSARTRSMGARIDYFDCDALPLPQGAATVSLAGRRTTGSRPVARARATATFPARCIAISAPRKSALSMRLGCSQSPRPTTFDITTFFHQQGRRTGAIIQRPSIDEWHVKTLEVTRTCHESAADDLLGNVVPALAYALLHTLNGELCVDQLNENEFDKIA